MIRLFSFLLALALASSAKAEPKAPAKEFTNTLDMKFVWVPAGEFIMGSPKGEGGRSTREFQHKVTLTKGFYMGIHPVTQEQWKTVMGSNPGHFSGEKNLPVEQVSWEDSQGFIKKLREKDKKPYRLPTEAEWEYACRAGTTTAFHFGKIISADRANYKADEFYEHSESGVYRKKTTPVGSFPANAFGLYDMHGNVCQWCEDLYGAYPQNDVVDPQGLKVGEDHVLRGSSWDDNPFCCRSAWRVRGTPGKRENHVGLRLCFYSE